MAKKSNAGLAWGIGLGTVALATVGIILYERSAGATTAPGSGATGATLPAGANAAATTDVANALHLSAIGHGAGKEGDVWARKAVTDGATAAQLAQLRAVGYQV